MIYFQDTAVTLPSWTSTQSGISTVLTTHTITGITTGSIVFANLRDDTGTLSVALAAVSVSRSTANEVHCQFVKTTTLAFTGTTATINFLAVRF